MNDELRDKIETSCKTADEFVKLYYHSFDKRRHLITRMFHDTGVCVWNGNPASGKENIQKLFAELPTTFHTVTTLDVQPIIDEAVAGQLTFLIQVGGTVKYAEKQSKIFQQSFVITAAGDTWKIVSDCYRLQDALSAAAT